MGPNTRLLVIVPDRVSDLVSKGEITPRYYNPGDVFDEVHLLMTNDDRPEPSVVQGLVGRASLEIHNLPLPGFIHSLGWRPFLLNRWAEPAVALAERIRPALVRCHGAHLNAFLGMKISRRLGIPYAVSLHANPDEDVRGRAEGWREHVEANAIRSVEKKTLREADLVLPVYRPIVPFLERIGVERYEVAYNVLNAALRHKQRYELGSPARVISVGRQFEEKNPDNLIRAVAALDEVELTLVGDGAAHEHLRAVARESGADGRVTFRRSVPNDELCSLLAEHDVFATHSEYWEISKAVLEAFYTGLPVVLNRRHGEPVPELTDDIALLVENTPAGYREALAELLADDARRQGLGERGRERALREWAPPVTEARYAAIYRDLGGLEPATR